MRKRHAFTLTELFVVIGAIAVLISLVVPVASKARSTAKAAGCLSNLRQMGTAWTMYAAENRGALVPYMWSSPQPENPAYKGYWFGILDSYGIKAEALLCPSADTPFYTDAGLPRRRGYGAAAYAWTGRFGPNGTAITFTTPPPPPPPGSPPPPTPPREGIVRDGSYGYNRYLTASGTSLGGGFGPDSKATTIFSIPNLADVPAFMDCVFADVMPNNSGPAVTPKLPKDLTGMSATPGTPDLWKLLIARHGTAINVCMADGSARTVPLTDLYMLTWKTGWQNYSLPLP